MSEVRAESFAPRGSSTTSAARTIAYRGEFRRSTVTSGIPLSFETKKTTHLSREKIGEKAPCRKRNDPTSFWDLDQRPARVLTEVLPKGQRRDSSDDEDDSGKSTRGSTLLPT